MRHQSLVAEDAPAGPVIEIEGVRKAFGSTVVLDGIDLVVQAREVVCLLGRSGSGKTTLLRCINHLERPDFGSIRVCGQHVGYEVIKNGVLREASPRAIARSRKGIGMVFQHFNLFPHMTIAENVAVGPLHVLGKTRDEAREIAADRLGQVGMAPKADLYPSAISGGQRQRVAIARALAMDPILMLFDEPTSALDPELTGEVLDTMSDLARDGMTMVVVTHEVGFARAVGTRVVFLDDGRICEQGPAAQVIDEPQEERTRAFLAAVK